MQINSFSSIPQISTTAFKGAAQAWRGPVYCDTFEKTAKDKPIENPFGAKDELKIFKLMPKIVRNLKYNTISEECKNMAFNSIVAGNMLKKQYDDEFGENNYVFVSIGTSPAGIGRYLEFMGQDVRYVPISDLRKIGFSINQLTEFQDYDKYSNYLDSLGLSRKALNKDDRKYIFCDFTSSGKTLEAVKYFALEHRCLPKSKTEFRSLNVDLANYSNKHKKNLDVACEYIRLLDGSKMAKFSGISHLNCMVVNNIDEAIKTPRRNEAKDFNFAMLYMLNEENMLP